MRAAALPRSDSVHENKLPCIARLYFHLIFKMTTTERARAPLRGARRQIAHLHNAVIY